MDVVTSPYMLVIITRPPAMVYSATVVAASVPVDFRTGEHPRTRFRIWGPERIVDMLQPPYEFRLTRLVGLRMPIRSCATFRIATCLVPFVPRSGTFSD